MSRFDRILTFVNIVEFNSFSKAAKKLKTTAATVTRQMNTLEKELGMQLIERNTRNLKLSDIGRNYYIEAKKLVDQFHVTESLITHSHAEPSGNLKVTVHHHFAENFVTPYLEEFLSHYPHIRLDLKLEQKQPHFQKEDADILFGTIGDGDSDLVRRCILHSDFIFCASPNYLAKYGTPTKPKDLLNHRFIIHSIFPTQDSVTFENHEPIALTPILRVNDTGTMIQAALNGLSIIKLLEFRVHHLLKSGQLVKVLPDYTEKNFPMYYYYRESRYHDPKIRAFIDFFLQKTLQNLQLSQ